MMTFLSYLAEMRVKTVAPGIAIPVPSKSDGRAKPKPPKPLAPAVKSKAPALEPLTLDQALEKSAQIAVLGRFARERLGRSLCATGRHAGRLLTAAKRPRTAGLSSKNLPGAARFRAVSSPCATCRAPPHAALARCRHWALESVGIPTVLAPFRGFPTSTSLSKTLVFVDHAENSCEFLWANALIRPSLPG